MRSENIYDLLEQFSGHEVRQILMSKVKAGESRKSLTVMTKIYGTLQPIVLYEVDTGKNIEEFHVLQYALERYLELP